MQHATYPSLAGQRVVITGGGTGIGVAIVEAFARQGAHVTFLDIAHEASRALQEKLAHLPQPPVFRYCDLTDLGALAATFAEIKNASGGTDILVNNAANDDRHQLQDVTPAYWDERMAVNLRHQYFCAQAVAPAMRAKGRGVILNLGSISWHLAQANLSIYMTAKAEAVILQGQCLQTRVEPEDVAALALFLASDNAAKCAGREYYVDAGWYGA